MPGPSCRPGLAIAHCLHIGTLGRCTGLIRFRTAWQQNPVGTYLSARATLVGDLAAQVREQALQWTAASAPGMGAPADRTEPRVLAEIAVFRAAHGVEDADTRTTGPDQYRSRSTMAQNALRRAVNDLLPDAHSATRRWHHVAETLEPRLTTDWFWPPAWPGVSTNRSVRSRC